MSQKTKYTPDPNRFEASKLTVWVDQFMNYFISVGGIAIIAAVLGIFVFITYQVLPLFAPAYVKPGFTNQLPQGDYVVFAFDEYVELPFTIDRDGNAAFHDVKFDRGMIDAGNVLPSRSASAPVAEEASTDAPAETSATAETTEAPAETTETAASDVKLTASYFNAAKQQGALGFSDGSIRLFFIEYSPVFSGDYNPNKPEEGRRFIGKLTLGEPFRPEDSRGEIFKIGYGDGGENKIIVALEHGTAGEALHVIELQQEQSLMGAGELKMSGELEPLGMTPVNPTNLLVNQSAEGILISTDKGVVHYMARDGSDFRGIQTFTPFEGLANPKITKMNFVFGDNTVVFVSETGVNIGYSLYSRGSESGRLWGETKKFPDVEFIPTVSAVSNRNKSFVYSGDGKASLRYSTTEDIRWEGDAPDNVIKVGIAAKEVEVIVDGARKKYSKLLFLDKESKLHTYLVKDPHPEASINALFGQIWYEGGQGYEYKWQSTGGSQEFEPKLSMIPLIFGSLKGTFYGMLFAVPLALTAAIYTSQFADPVTRRIVKPTMEVMASLPSVVLGFMAALWLAPLVEDRFPSLLLMFIAIPVVAYVLGVIADSLPTKSKNWVQGGNEWWIFIPVTFLVCAICWWTGPVIEGIFFVPQGSDIGNFKEWWPQVAGVAYEQRNSLIVGFAMGFAVIPILFTISEDAMSNVPQALRSGSLALGATRWETALRIVLPSASAGIFSALMIALGRAVGETMIMVMATGNTALMEGNIFSGMRTLSANIAVELPEAPQFGTLYRALFLGAVVLFIMTFVINTVAEVLRQRLREKFQTY